MNFYQLLLYHFRSLPDYWWCILLAVALISVVAQIVMYRTGYSIIKTAASSFLYTYCAFILLITVLNRSTGEGMKLIPFWSYLRAFQGEIGYFREILLNYFLFIPYGFFHYFKEKSVKRAVVCGLLFSASIEVIQLLFNRGLFEFDDLICNSVGCLIGAIGGWVLNYAIVNYWCRRSRQSCKRDC